MPIRVARGWPRSMDRLRRFSIVCAAAFFAFAVILGVSITRTYEGSVANPRIWAILLGGFAALYALLFAIVWKTRIFSEQRDLSLQLVSLMNNVPGAVYRGLPDWTVPFMGANIEKIVGHSPGGIHLRPKTVERDRPPRGPGHAEAACPRGRADPRARPPARVPPSAPGRFRPVGGGPPPDDLRRGREAAVGRRPHPRHHRPEAIGRRVAPHPVHRRPGKRIHLLDGPGRPPHLRQRPDVRGARLFAGRAPFHEDPGDQPGVPPRAVAVPLGRVAQPADLLGRIDAPREGRPSHPRGAHGELHRVRREGVQLRLRPRHHRAQAERRVDRAGAGFLEGGPRQPAGNLLSVRPEGEVPALEQEFRGDHRVLRRGNRPDASAGPVRRSGQGVGPGAGSRTPSRREPRRWRRTSSRKAGRR